MTSPIRVSFKRSKEAFEVRADEYWHLVSLVERLRDRDAIEVVTAEDSHPILVRIGPELLRAGLQDGPRYSRTLEAIFNRIAQRHPGGPAVLLVGDNADETSHSAELAKRLSTARVVLEEWERATSIMGLDRTARLVAIWESALDGFVPEAALFLASRSLPDCRLILVTDQDHPELTTAGWRSVKPAELIPVLLGELG